MLAVRVSPEEGVHPYAEVMIEPRDHARLKTNIHPNRSGRETLETSRLAVVSLVGWFAHGVEEEWKAVLLLGSVEL